MSKPIILRRKIKKRVIRKFRMGRKMPARTQKKEKILELKFAANKEEVKERIRQFIQQRPGSRTSQIIEGLRIDPVQAIEVLGELERDDKVMSKEIGQ